MDPVSKEDKIWVMENFFKTKKFAEYNSVSDLLGNKIKLHIFYNITDIISDTLKFKNRF